MASAPALDAAAHPDDAGFNAAYRRLAAEDDAPEGAATSTRRVARFFQRSENYVTCHAAPAVLLANELFQNGGQVRYFRDKSGKPPLASLGMNKARFVKAIKFLLLERASHTVEMYEAESNGAWRLSREASPGKLGAFDEELFGNGASDNQDAPPSLAVVVHNTYQGRQVGVASLDANRRSMRATTFVDPSESLVLLEHVVMQSGARECVIVQPKDAASSDHRRVEEVLRRCAVLATARPKTDFEHRALKDTLARLLKGDEWTPSMVAETHKAILENPSACGALAGVLKFAEVAADVANHNAYTLLPFDTQRFMRVDSAAAKALNVFPPIRGGTASSLVADAAGGDAVSGKTSLFALLCQQRTAPGKRLLRMWLKQPLVDRGEIGARHDVVELLSDAPAMLSTLRDAVLRGLPDSDYLTRKLEKRTATLQDLCLLYKISSAVPLVCTALASADADAPGAKGRAAKILEERFVAPLSAAHAEDKLRRFEGLIEAAIDLSRIPEEYAVNPSYDEKLQELRSERDAIEARIEAMGAEAAKTLGLELGTKLKLERTAVHGFHFRITKQEEQKVRKRLQASKYTIFDTRKDGCKFHSAALRNAAADYERLTKSYDASQRALAAQIVDVAATFCGLFDGVTAAIAELDALCGFAHVVATSPRPFVRPTLSDAADAAGEVELHELRHPLVETLVPNFVPNDVRIDGDKTRMLVVTGANMGGKSTLLRAVGCAVLLAQVGMFVPCASARIACRDAIFARVGAGDALGKGLSTFMVEMLEAGAVLRAATPRSLILIDELGRGTSTTDGMALADAIARHVLEEVRAPCLFATHFHALARGLEGVEGARNAHLAATAGGESGVTLLYKVKEGHADVSFGVRVAQHAQLPAAVVEWAEERLAKRQCVRAC